MADKATYWSRKTAERNARAARARIKTALKPKMEILNAIQNGRVSQRTEPGEGRVILGIFSSVRKRMRWFNRFA